MEISARCTGYAKIIEAIELARDILNHEISEECLEVIPPSTGKTIGSCVERVDARGKMTGALEYAADMENAKNASYSSCQK